MDEIHVSLVASSVDPKVLNDPEAWVLANKYALLPFPKPNPPCQGNNCPPDPLSVPTDGGVITDVDPCDGAPCVIGSVCWPGCSYELTKCKGRASADLATCQSRARYRAFRTMVVGGGLTIASAVANKGKPFPTTKTIAVGTLGLSTWDYVVDLDECQGDYSTTVTRCEQDN